MRMILLILLLVAACAPTPDPLLPSPALDPPLVAPEEMRVEPLTLTLQASNIEEELLLATKLTCIPKGGIEPYTFNWEGVGDTCLEECDLLLTEIGTHTVTCNVVDAANQTVSESLTLTVLKEQRQLDSILFFGDSLTEGYGLESPEETAWPVIFSRSFSAVESHNLAREGTTTEGVLKEQLPVLEALPEGEALIFLWAGANDIITFTAPETFRERYEQLVTELETHGTLMLLNIPDATKLAVASDIETGVNDFLGEFGIRLDVKGVSQEIIQSYNQIILDVAATHDVRVIDMFTYHGEFDDSLITKDAFHPNEEGHILIAEKVADELEAAFPRVTFIG